MFFNKAKSQFTIFSPAIDSQDVLTPIMPSLPLTPQDSPEFTSLPPSSLLSNFCCEHNKAYTKEDLRPSVRRNYYTDRVIQSLKHDFDKDIPAKLELREFFAAPEKSFDQVQAEVRDKVDDILARLGDESDES